MRARSLVLYHYFERDAIYRSNVESFIRLGINSSSDFVFLVSGETNLDIPLSETISVLRVENLGSDFACFASVLNKTNLRAYDKFIFVNCTVVGPFLHTSQQEDWQTYLIAMLVGDVKLAGVSINVLPQESGFAKDCLEAFGKPAPYPHVQSMVFAVDRECLEFLIEKHVFCPTNSDRHSIIANSEIAMSLHVLTNGWNLACLVPEYKNLDFRNVEAGINPTAIQGDPWFPGGCFGRTLHPLETMFFKNNRGLRSSEEISSLVNAQISQFRK